MTQSFPEKQWCCAVFKLKSSILSPTPSGFSRIHGELPRKNSQHLPILVSWVWEGGGESVAFFVSLLQDVSFAGFYRKTISQSCLLMKAWSDSILSIFQPLINHSDSDWFPPSWFRIIIIISCPPFLQKVMIERESRCKKKHMRCAFCQRKAAPIFSLLGCVNVSSPSWGKLRSYEVALCLLLFSKKAMKVLIPLPGAMINDWLAELRFFVIKENPELTW